MFKKTPVENIAMYSILDAPYLITGDCTADTQSGAAALVMEGRADRLSGMTDNVSGAMAGLHSTADIVVANLI